MLQLSMTRNFNSNIEILSRQKTQKCTGIQENCFSPSYPNLFCLAEILWDSRFEQFAMLWFDLIWTTMKKGGKRKQYTDFVVHVVLMYPALICIPVQILELQFLEFSNTLGHAVRSSQHWIKLRVVTGEAGISHPYITNTIL